MYCSLQNASDRARLGIHEGGYHGLYGLRAGHELDQAQRRADWDHLVRAHLRTSKRVRGEQHLCFCSKKAPYTACLVLEESMCAFTTQETGIGATSMDMRNCFGAHGHGKYDFRLTCTWLQPAWCMRSIAQTPQKT